MTAPTNGKRFKIKKGDIIFILALVAVCAIALTLWFALREEGSFVSVVIDGRVVATYPLSVDRVEVIHSADGGENVLVIKDGKAYIESANCPGHDCTRFFPISYVGETIACRPHEVVIRIDGESDGPDVIG
jgi:hypothetical protein